MRKGKSEQEVLELLGDPWAIAKTIVDASDGTDEEVVYENRSPFNNSYNQTTQARDSYTGYGQKNEYGTEHSYGSYHEFRLDTWWKKALLILAVVFVVVVVVSVITGIISFLAPVLVPLLIIMNRDQTDRMGTDDIRKRKVKRRWGAIGLLRGV